MKSSLFQKINNRLFSGRLNHQINMLFITLILCCTAVPLGIFWFSAGKGMKEYTMAASEDVLISVGGVLNSSFETVSTLSKNILFSDEVRKYLNAPQKTSQADSFQAIQKIYSANIQFVNVSSLYIFRKDGNYINISADGTYPVVNQELLSDPEWKQDIAVKTGAYSIQLNGNGLFSLSSGQPLLTFIRVINDLETQQEIGVMAINFTASYLKTTLRDFLSPDKGAAVITSTGDLLCGDENALEALTICQTSKSSARSASEAGAFHYTKGNLLVSGYQIPDMPLTILRYEKMSYASYIAGSHFLLLFLMFLLTLLCFFIIHGFLTFRFTRPLEKLVESMKKVETGWLHRVSVDCSITEIQNLKDSYNQMLVQVNHLIEQLVEQEKAAQQAKLEVILEQMNPHFLYNTLETIGYMAFESPREEIYDAVECLGEFYRSFLNSGNDKVPLKKELETIQDYLKIQKFRYGEILEDHYDIEKDCEPYLVPKLIFQPLVENSLYHGIRPKGEKGEILVSAHLKDQKLCLSVYDTGIGMSPEKLEQVLSSSPTGFGLKKTLERLQYLYGEKDCYQIESQEGSFCRITLYLPLEKSLPEQSFL